MVVPYGFQSKRESEVVCHLLCLHNNSRNPRWSPIQVSSKYQTGLTQLNFLELLRTCYLGYLGEDKTYYYLRIKIVL